MPRCHQCRTELTREATICPRCGADIPEPDANKWVSIARLRNLAEAGFFADLLGDQQIECRIYQHDRFSALDGSWSMDYFLQVRQPEAEEAALWMQQYLDGEKSEPADDASPALRAWKPLALVLVCGGLAYWVGQGVIAARPARQLSHNPTLWEVLGRIDRPFTTSGEVGQARYRLQPDPEHDRIYLEEDRDGDGMFERHLEFSGGRLMLQAGEKAQ